MPTAPVSPAVHAASRGTYGSTDFEGLGIEFWRPGHRKLDAEKASDFVEVLLGVKLRIGTGDADAASPRVHAELVEGGLSISRKRVARLMKAASLAGVSRRRFVTTTVRDGGRQAPTLSSAALAAGAPNVLWVADITYIPTWSGFLYLAVVLDAFSRRIVGWSMSLTLARRYRACGAEHGARRPQAEKRDPPFGSRLAIHIQPLPRGGRSSLHGLGWRRLRQRYGGELFRHA